VKNAFIIGLAACLILHLWMLPVAAQLPTLPKSSVPSASPSLGASAYVYDPIGSPGLKIEVYIWGQVKRPGLYIVPDNTNVLSLISLAGGPDENAKLNRVRLVRSNPETKQQHVINVDVARYLETGDMNEIPGLLPGDTVVVSGTVFKAFSKSVTFISGIATIAAAYFLIFDPNYRR